MMKTGNTYRLFLKLVKFEIKRYFTNKTLLIIACVVPIIILITFLSSLLPVLFRGAELNDIKIALYNEDPSFETNLIVRHLTESDSVEGFIDVIDVESIIEGKEMMEDKKASALIHIPKDLQTNLYNGKSQTINFYSGENNKQIVKLLYDMLSGGLNNINQAQKSVNIIFYAMNDMGYDRQEAVDEYRNLTKRLFTNIVSRSEIYKGYSEVSATGDYLNIEYYSISILLLCLFFLSLPICSKISADKYTGVLERGIFNLSSSRYLLSKALSGAMFLLLPSTITTMFILLISNSFGLFSGNVFLLIVTIIISCIYFTTIMLCIGLYTKSITSAIWIGFSIALTVSLLSGIFIPRNLMPRCIVSISEITMLPVIARLYGYSVFGIKNDLIISDLLKVTAFNAILFSIGYLKTRKHFIKI